MLKQGRIRICFSEDKCNTVGLVKRNTVIFYNILTALAPVLLLAGIVCLILSGCGESPDADDMKAFSIKGAILSIMAALIVRIVWGIGTRRERKRRKDDRGQMTDDSGRLTP